MNNASTSTTTTTANTVVSPSPIQQINPYSHDIQMNKKIKNGNTADRLSSASPIETSATSESSDNTRSPLPRAWRGRFGVFEKKCENCQTNTSPEWRKGPGGHKT